MKYKVYKETKVPGPPCFVLIGTDLIFLKDSEAVKVYIEYCGKPKRWFK